VDSTGQIVTAAGEPLSPSIRIPTNALSVTIANNGQVSVLQPGTVTPAVVGQIELATFINPAGLSAQGGNNYKETSASGTPQIGAPASQEFGSLNQGFVETSNVNVVEELTSMILAQRAYEMNSKAITTSDQMMQTANALKQ
jgi:flagellar basal-body rod protein FlgG